MPAKTHTLVQFTDTHLQGGELLYGAVDPAANLQRAIDHAIKTVDGVDALLFTGDLANAGQPAAYQQLRSIIDAAAAEFGVPAWVGMGNHDAREPFRAGLLDGAAAPAGATAAPYAADGPGAPVDYVATVGDLRIVMLDSTVPGHHHGELDATQIAWMSAQLADHSGSTIIAFHHPPMPFAADGHMAELGDALRFDGLDEVGAALAEHSVSMVLSGHFHDPRGGRLGNTSVWAGAATAMTHEVDVEAGVFKIIESIGYTQIDVFDDCTAIASAIDVTADNVLAEMTFAELSEKVEELSAS